VSAVASDSQPSDLRTEAEEEEITDKLDSILKKKTNKLSDSAKKAIAKSVGGDAPESNKKTKGSSTSRQITKSSQKKGASRKMVKRRSLDEVLKSAADDDRPKGLARRDVYEEVGITQAEVKAYWDRRAENAQNFTDRIAFLGYPLTFVIFIAIGYSVYDSIVAPQETVLASMTGTD
jgi:hypothetical protein